jgi:hypothetical protein
LRKRGLSVNYFANLEAECHFPKLGCNESNFPNKKGHQCNLSFIFSTKKRQITQQKQEHERDGEQNKRNIKSTKAYYPPVQSRQPQLGKPKQEKEPNPLPDDSTWKLPLFYFLFFLNYKKRRIRNTQKN